MDAKEIIKKNQSVIDEMFEGRESGNFYDGTSHQLYLDVTNNTLFIEHFPSGNSWLQRDDGTLIQIMSVQGHETRSDDELYDPDTCDRYDYGYGYFLDEVEQLIEDAIHDYKYAHEA